MAKIYQSHRRIDMNSSLIVITGPTASGKTRRAVDIAKSIDGEIISADSRQIYRRMDIGTGKDLKEYESIPYHLIDICPAGYKYNLFEYLRDFEVAYNDIQSRGKNPILCGGTGLYVESVIKGLRLPQVPENKELRKSLEEKTLEELTTILSSFKTLHNKTDIDTAKRAIRAIEIQQYYQQHPEEAVKTVPCPMDNVLIIGVEIDRENRRKRISERLTNRLEEGMIEEVSLLLKSGITPDDLIYYGLEYKFITLYLIGQISYDKMVSELEIAIHQFAKRQMTWFRGMERRGFSINWLPWDMPSDEFINEVKRLDEK